MTATDELRAMLDERGVKWTATSKDVTMDNQTYCHPHTFTEFQDGLMVTNLTPEQAIAATLGERSNTNQNGVTAEQVREAIFNGSVYASYDGAKYYADGINMQAIADALNAMLGHSLNNPSMSETLSERGTCKNKATSLRTFWCDCCDCALEDWMDVGGKLINGLRYCPNCGRKVEG